MLVKSQGKIQSVREFWTNVCNFVWLYSYYDNLLSFLTVNEKNIIDGNDKRGGSSLTYVSSKINVKILPKTPSSDGSCAALFSKCVTADMLISWTYSSMNKQLAGTFDLSSSCTVDNIQFKIEDNGTK